jgi:pimeloyl-ACP methyl ester carboxylesterase
MGGAIASEFARTFPDRVAKLALIAPAGLPVDEPALVRHGKAVPVVNEMYARSAFSLGRGLLTRSPLLADVTMLILTMVRCYGIALAGFCPVRSC